METDVKFLFGWLGSEFRSSVRRIPISQRYEKFAGG